MAYLFGLIPSWNDRQIKKYRKTVAQVNDLETHFEAFSDTDLRDMTDRFRERLEDGETLDDLLPEAFAVVREAAKRTLQMRHFDVQIMGGIALHEGRIAEMKTGEGKTLVATMPLYLNALARRGAHLVTVNDYLARRDSEWMGQVYRFLGLTVGCILHDLDFNERREAYGADITYGTNNEFGFDYLRDNMGTSPEELVQRELNYAIIDEVDSILIDEARTPLIISGPAERSAAEYRRFAQIVQQLKRDIHYTVDEKAHSVVLTEEGIARAESLAGVQNIYDPSNMKMVHYLNAALKAKELYKRDNNYIVNDQGEVVIVDEFTGRLMPGRRWSDGIHQSVEAKEKVKIQRESQTLATITFQNFFRLYNKLSGMTGTAKTEEHEFSDIYKLDVLVIPTHKPMIREDLPDVIFRTQPEKYNAIVEEVAYLHERGQPVLVGTRSIDVSEMLATRLKKRGVPCEVLNAKHHAREAEIVKDAGLHGSVTIATNMAGRGTDIMLDEKAKEAGGLFILGTERHDSRRIDDQLRGRSGRQGDRGASQFYLSMEDDLMRLFGGPNIRNLMDKLGWQDGEPIEARMVSNAIEKAQKRVEMHHFDIRKNVLKYDDVMNEQRNIIYEQRQKALKRAVVSDGVLEQLMKAADAVYHAWADRHASPSAEDYQELRALLRRVLRMSDEEIHLDPDLSHDEQAALVRRAVKDHYRALDTLQFDRLGESVRNSFMRFPRVYARALVPEEEGDRLSSRALTRLCKTLSDVVLVAIHPDDLRGLTREEVLKHCKERIDATVPPPQFLLHGSVHEDMKQIFEDVVEGLVEGYCSSEVGVSEWAFEDLCVMVKDLSGVTILPKTLKEMEREEIRDHVLGRIREAYDEREAVIGTERLQQIEKYVLLQVVDEQWKDHLYIMDGIQESIHWQGYAGKNPLVEYKIAARDAFNEMIYTIKERVMRFLFHLEISGPEEELPQQVAPRKKELTYGRGTGDGSETKKEPIRVAQKVGRNQPCPCGSGKKYKKCCGAVA